MNPQYKIFFKVISRERPEKFKRTIDNIVGGCEDDNYFIVATLDSNDPSMNNAEIKNFCKQNNVIPIYGTSKSKIDAFNRDMDSELIPKDWDIVITISDDQLFNTWGFDNIIRNDMFKYFPQCDGALHYPDGNPYPPEDLMTLNIFGRKLYERLGYIYWHEYFSVWCDNDVMEVLKIWGKHKFIPNQIYDHLHPAFLKSEWDEMARRNETAEVHLKDKNIFEERKKRNFDLS